MRGVTTGTNIIALNIVNLYAPQDSSGQWETDEVKILDQIISSVKLSSGR